MNVSSATYFLVTYTDSPAWPAGAAPEIFVHISVMSDSLAIVTTADGAEPPADGAGRRRTSLDGAVPLYSGLEHVEFQKGWMAKAIGAPTSGGKEFTYYVVAVEREGPASELPKFWRNHVETVDVAGTVGVGTFLTSDEWEYLRIDMNNAHVHASGCFHYKRCVEDGKTRWYCLETRDYDDEVINAPFLCKIYQGVGGDCKSVRPITKSTYWEVFRCLRAENDKKALDCMRTVSSLIGTSVAEMRRVHIDKKQPYKRTKASKLSSSNKVAKRKLMEKSGKTRWIYRDGKVVDVNWEPDKVFCGLFAL